MCFCWDKSMYLIISASSTAHQLQGCVSTFVTHPTLVKTNSTKTKHGHGQISSVRFGLHIFTIIYTHLQSFTYIYVLWEHLQETPIFHGKNHGFRLRFPQETNPLNLQMVGWYPIFARSGRTCKVWLFCCWGCSAAAIRTSRFGRVHGIHVKKNISVDFEQVKI